MSSSEVTIWKGTGFIADTVWTVEDKATFAYVSGFSS